MPDDPLSAINAAAAGHRLFVSGTLPVLPSDDLPGARAIALLSPDEPGFWPHLAVQPEFADGAPDPLDRWSARVVADLATRFGARPLLPFGGPPWHPFSAWALRSGRAHPSPVTLLVHDRMGLWASWRGALALAAPLPATAAANPCETCAARPCLTACPPAALTAGGYDLGRCHDFLATPAGAGCLGSGCAVRGACPVSRRYGRLPGQNAHHMRHFHP